MSVSFLLQRPWLADVLLLAVALVWGTSYGVTKSALAWYPVAGLLALRFGLSFLILAPGLWHRARGRWRAHARAGLLTGGVLLAILCCETAGVGLTRAANAAFLINLCVVFTPFVEWLWLRRRPAPRVFVAAAVSLLGAWLLVSEVSLGVHLGDALILAAALLRACQSCLIHRVITHHRVSTLAVTALQSGVVALGALLIALILGGLPPLPAVASFWGQLGYLVVFCSLFAFFAQNQALATRSPSRAALLMGCEPVFGALFAAWYLGEATGLGTWLGGALLVGASLCLSLPIPLRRRAVGACDQPA